SRRWGWSVIAASSGVGQHPPVSVPDPLFDARVSARDRLDEDLIEFGEPFAHITIDPHACLLEIPRTRRIEEISTDTDQHPAGSDHHGEQVDHVHDLVLSLEERLDRHKQITAGLLADEEITRRTCK